MQLKHVEDRYKDQPHFLMMRAEQAMRFDDSLLRVFGDRLEALTGTAHAFPDTATYDGRAFGAVRAPGALLTGLDFTL